MIKRIFAMFTAIIIIAASVVALTAYAVTAIQPTQDGKVYVYEAEKGTIGAGCYLNTSIPGASDGKCVNLLNGSITMEISVPTAGNYKVSVASANDNNGGRCDCLQVNGGTKYYIATPASPVKTFSVSEPGTENWVGGELKPIPLSEGFTFNKGVNTVVISANWGYAYYDKIMLEPIVEEQDPVKNVIALINALPETVTENNRSAVEKAESAYNKLTGSQKAEVTNYGKLLEKLAMINGEVQTAVKDGDKLIYEAEKCVFSGSNAYKATVFENYSGDGYVFVMTDGFKIKINVPVAGTYKMFVATANDANGGRCEYISVNGGTKYLIAAPANPQKTWVVCEPGTENWVNNELKPIPVESGFTFLKGENTVQIDVNWGYAAYDKIILVPTGNTVLLDEDTINEINEGIAQLPEIITSNEITAVTELYRKYNSLNESDRAFIKDRAKLIRSNAMENEIKANPKAKAGAMRYECELGKMIGNSSPVSEKSIFKDYSGDGYVFLFDKSFEIEVFAPYAGYYDIKVISGMTEDNNKCDYLSVNGGEKMLVATGAGKGVWQTSAPGSENWVEGKLIPLSSKKGIRLKAGSNKITVSANWGYCAYDAIQVIPRGNSPTTGENTSVYVLLFAAVAVSAFVMLSSLKKIVAHN